MNKCYSDFAVMRRGLFTGVGKALMQAGLGELDYQAVVVWVLKDNKRAIRFYEKCGFCIDGREKVIKLGSPIVEIRMIRKAGTGNT